MARKQPKSPTTGGAQLSPRAIVVMILAVVVIGILFVSLPVQDPTKSSGPSPAPMFKTQGTADIVDPGGEVKASLSLEIADTEELREVGLMGRPTLEFDQGMFFIFPEEAERAFWMENTILSLDMLFISADNTINTIHKSTTPYSRESYASSAPAMYVLEVPVGFCDRFGVNVGDKLRWKRL